MDNLKIDPHQPDERVLKEAASMILAGAVVAFPTDTAYGLAANALDENAIGKLFIMKKRLQKPLPIMVDSVDMLKKYVHITPEEQKLIDAHWPGALTIIFKRKDTIPDSLTLGLPTVGARIPEYDIAKRLVAICDKPLTSTSANISGKGNCYSAECVFKMFEAQPVRPNLVLDAGTISEVPVSTVVQVEEGQVNVLREGPVKIKS